MIRAKQRNEVVVLDIIPEKVEILNFRAMLDKEEKYK